jgi:hypothetical protein
MSSGIPDEQFVIAIISISAVFGLPFLGLMIWMITHYACTALKTSQEIALKRDMIARGFTVQEIVEVISAKRGSKAKSHLANVPPAKPVKQPVYSP